MRRLDLPNLPPRCLHGAPRLLIALLLFLVGLGLAARVANVSRRALQRAHVEPPLVSFLRNGFYGVLIAMMSVGGAGLDFAGIPTASLVAPAAPCESISL